MAKCPSCKTKQSYFKLFSLLSNRAINCENCGTTLRANQILMLPFYIFFNSLAGVFGLAMTISGDYIKWLTVLAIWIIILLAVYPMVLRVKIANNK